VVILTAGVAAVVVGGILALGLGRLQSSAAPATAAVVASPMQVPAEALERYERARFLLNRREPGDMAQSLNLFEQALRIEPRYARAWAGIASVRWIDTMEGRLVRSQGLELTRAAATSAEARSSQCRSPFATRELLPGHRRHQRSNALVRHAAALDPLIPWCWNSMRATRRAGQFDVGGRPAAACRAGRAAVGCDATQPGGVALHGGTLRGCPRPSSRVARPQQG
jgi:hypothetical protein